MVKRMKWANCNALLLVLLAVAIAVPLRASTASLPTEAQSGEVVRIKRDPHTGSCWQLMRPKGNRGGPGRNIQVSDKECASTSSKYRDELREKVESSLQTPVIQAGDHLIIEEHSAVVETRLQAVALSAAAAGAHFKARLELGRKVVEAVAIGSGRAVFAPQQEAKQ